MYGLESVIDNLANNSTPLIISLGIVNTQGMPAPLDIFKDMYKDRAFMRRLAMVSKGSLVQTGVSIPQIQQVMQQFPVFQRNIDLTGGLVNLNTKDQKDILSDYLIMKLLLLPSTTRPSRLLKKTPLLKF